MPNIYIPSHKRSEKQCTLENFNDHLRSNSILVVQHSQKKAYEAVAQRYNIKDLVVLPKHIQTLSPTYEHIIRKLAKGKFFICDDDSTFSYREFASLGEKSLTRCNNSEQLTTLYDILCKKLDDFVYVGVSARAGNNHVEPSDSEDGTWTEVTRMSQFTGYQSEPLEWIETNRVKCRDDFDRHLQLMEQGFKNAVTYDYAIDQEGGGSNSAGGCSTYRNAAMLRDEAYKLQSLHPQGIVSVVEKKTKADWGVGGVRTDVRIQWKKAYNNA